MKPRLAIGDAPTSEHSNLLEFQTIALVRQLLRSLLFGGKPNLRSADRCGFTLPRGCARAVRYSSR